MTWVVRWRVPLLLLSGGVAFALGLGIVMLGGARPQHDMQTLTLDTIDDYGSAPAFMLTDQLERTVSSEEFRGKVVVANFIYTHCRDICPLLSTQMQSLQDRLRTEDLLGSQVQLLSFSVDPTRDTPSVLRAYAERHQADSQAWRFLTGAENDVLPLVVDGFHLGVQVLPPVEASPVMNEGSGHGDTDYEVMHSGRFVLIDPQGRIRAYYDGQTFDPDRIVADLRRLLREGVVPG